MYGTFYGLNAPPFSPRPDIKFLYLDENRHRLLEMVEYTVRESGGFCVISGKAGIGKTILVQALVKRLGEQVHAGVFTCIPGLSPRFTELIATAFDIDTANASTREMYRRIKNHVANLNRAGKDALLVIDNAHNLKPAMFKLLVHLVNVDSALRVVLVGYPELRRQFSRSALGELAPDVIIQTSLPELSRIDTEAYIRHRLVIAGGAAKLFSQSACETVYRYSRGVPGLINCVSNYALEAGYEGKHPEIDVSILSDLVKDRDDLDALDFAQPPQKLSASPVAAESANGVRPGPETETSSEQDIRGLILMSLRDHYRKNRRLTYATLAGILLPATVAVWLLLQSRPGENREPAVATQLANPAQPAPGRAVDAKPRATGSAPPALSGRPEASQTAVTTQQLAQSDMLDGFKAGQHKPDRHLADPHAEQARSEQSAAPQPERKVEIGSLPGKLVEAEAEPVIPAAVPATQDAPASGVVTVTRSPAETETLATIEALRQQRYELERRIAVQRSEYNLLRQEIQIESDRIAKARAMIKRAYKGARLIWNNLYRTTPEPFPEDAE